LDKLREVTGYCPRVSIDEGIQRFVDCYLNEYLPLGLAEPPLFLLPPPVGLQGEYQEVSSPVLGGWAIAKDVTRVAGWIRA
jgi:hypothetical protein